MKRLEEQLTALVKPSVDLPLHRAQLRRAVLNSSHPRFGSFTRFSMSFSKLFPASLALVLVFGLAFTFRSQTPDYVQYVVPDASAEELVNGTLEHLQSLSADELEQLAAERGFTVDGIFSDLQNAIAADDLSLAQLTPLSCDELSKEAYIDISDISYGEDGVISLSEPCYAFRVNFGPDRTSEFGYSPVYVFHGSIAVAEAKGLTPIQYTTADGDRVGLFITEDFFPTMGIYYDPSVENTTMTFQAIEDSSQDVETQQTFESVDGDAEGCTNWQSEDGMIGGGGC